MQQMFVSGDELRGTAAISASCSQPFSKSFCLSHGHGLPILVSPPSATKLFSLPSDYSPMFGHEKFKPYQFSLQFVTLASRIIEKLPDGHA